MRKQRLMGVALIVIAWLVLLLAYIGGPEPEGNDATAALLVGPLGLYMLYSDTYLLYDSEATEEKMEGREPDPWAPTSPGGQSNPLYPYSSPFYQEYGKELHHGKKASYRSSEPPHMGGRE